MMPKDTGWWKLEPSDRASWLCCGVSAKRTSHTSPSQPHTQQDINGISPVHAGSGRGKALWSKFWWRDWNFPVLRMAGVDPVHKEAQSTFSSSFNSSPPPQLTPHPWSASQNITQGHRNLAAEETHLAAIWKAPWSAFLQSIHELLHMASRTSCPQTQDKKQRGEIFKFFKKQATSTLRVTQCPVKS